MHVDFCGENLVATDSGGLVCIDNATIDVGPHEYDLARSWYRWPLSAACRGAFLEGYVEHRSAASFLGHARFWMIQALMVSVAYRARLGAATVATPVALLQQLLAGSATQGADGGLFGLAEPRATIAEGVAGA